MIAKRLLHRLNIANYLLDEGANLEARCKLTDMTPLHYAAYFDCPLIADLLILRGACINARSFLIDNATPLHLAASQLSLGTARILIQAADFSVTKTGQRYDAKDAKDGLGRTPYGKLIYLVFCVCVFSEIMPIVRKWEKERSGLDSIQHLTD
ncbi:unnamed protein product [Trichobilharzia regenti]|nr:unnamed protein product [Trichobilharzia regenti]